MKFKVGDPVWCNCRRPENRMVGELPGIVTGIVPGALNTYLVEIFGHPPPPPYKSFSAREDWLRPRRDDPPTREALGEWELCPWRPRAVEEKRA